MNTDDIGKKSYFVMQLSINYLDLTSTLGLLNGNLKMLDVVMSKIYLWIIGNMDQVNKRTFTTVNALSSSGCITVMSQWASWCLKSPATWLFSRFF